MLKSIAEFVGDAYRSGVTPYATDFRTAGYFESPSKNMTPHMYKWCDERFGPNIEFDFDNINAFAGAAAYVAPSKRRYSPAHYTWTGSTFWFDKIENRDWFKARWYADVTRWCDIYNWAIDMGPNPDDFITEMRDLYGITVEETHDGYAALLNDEQAVRAQLIRPDSDLYDLRKMTHY